MRSLLAATWTRQTCSSSSGRTLRICTALTAPAPSKWVWPDDFPSIALAQLLALIVIHRAGPIPELLDVATGGGRRVEKHDSAGLAAGVLPRVRDVAWEERARARAADRHLVADLEGDLAGKHPGDLVAVTVEMKKTLRARGHGFLEQHDALVGVAA